MIYWRWFRVLAPIVIVLPVILACPVRPIETPKTTLQAATNKYFPQSLEKDVDLLFMIDNSPSMAPIQQNLLKNFPLLIEALRSHKLGPETPGQPCTAQDRRKCNIPDVQIGVISSDIGAGNYPGINTCETPGGDGGRLQNKARGSAGCPTPKDPFIKYIGGQTNIQNGQGSAIEQVKNAFKCIAFLGDAGCGFEHVLEATRRALDPKLNVNPNFVRQGAFLVVVWITNEDDCSAQKSQLFDPSQQGLTDPLGPLQSFRCTEFGFVCDEKALRQPGQKHHCVPGLDWLYKVEDYVKFFEGLKPPGRTILFSIAAPASDAFEVLIEGNAPILGPSCTGTDDNGQAIHGDPAIRLKSVITGSKKYEGHFDEGMDDAGNIIPVNICQKDYSPALRLLGEKIVASLGGQCISSPPLTTSGGLACHKGDSYSPGVTCDTKCLDQTDCIVDQITGQGTSAEKSTTIPKCSPGPLWDPATKDCGSECPCWRLVPSSECIPAKDGSPYGLNILRKGEAEKGTVASVQCATAPKKWNSAELKDIPQCQGASTSTGTGTSSP
jgi:hypothetical protein